MPTLVSRQVLKTQCSSHYLCSKGELAICIKELLDDLQKKHHMGKNISSIEEMKSFVDNYGVCDEGSPWPPWPHCPRLTSGTGLSATERQRREAHSPLAPSLTHCWSSLSNACIKARAGDCVQQWPLFCLERGHWNDPKPQGILSEPFLTYGWCRELPSKI